MSYVLLSKKLFLVDLVITRLTGASEPWVEKAKGANPGEGELSC